MFQSVHPAEAEPIGLLAMRIQADPSLALALPGDEEVAQPQRWSRRLRFVLEAALCGELDQRGIVEAVAPVPEDQDFICVTDLGLALDALWRPVVDEKLVTLSRDEPWLPFFERSQALLDEGELLNEDAVMPATALDYYKEVFHESSPSLVARYVGGLYLAATSKKARPQPDALSVVRQSVATVRRVGVRGFDTAVQIMRDFEAGDRNQILELPGDRARLHFTQPLKTCPVGTEGQTVAESEEIAFQKGEAVCGCPAIKNGRIVEKLAYRIIDDAEQRGLLA